MAAQVLGSPSPCNYTLEMHKQYPQDHWHCPFIINEELSGKKKKQPTKQLLCKSNFPMPGSTEEQEHVIPMIMQPLA